MNKKQFYIGVSLIWLCAALSWLDLTPFALAAAVTALAYFTTQFVNAAIEYEEKKK